MVPRTARAMMPVGHEAQEFRWRKERSLAARERYRRFVQESGAGENR